MGTPSLSSPRQKMLGTLIAQAGGRVTRVRVAVLDILQSAHQALTHDEVEAALSERQAGADRVTLYRTLDWFVQCGLAHRVHGADRAWRFAVVAPSAGTAQHAHFHCERCGRVVCLAQGLTLPDLQPGYALTRAELNLFGACPNCQKTGQTHVSA